MQYSNEQRASFERLISLVHGTSQLTALGYEPGLVARRAAELIVGLRPWRQRFIAAPDQLGVFDHTARGWAGSDWP